MFCPKYRDLKPRPCPRPPTKEALIEELNKEIALKVDPNKVLPYTKQRMPDLAWLLDSLSSLNEQHKIFQKSFAPAKKNDSVWY